MRVLFSQGLIGISKPRCGSTSVRRMLDKMIDLTKGDIAVDIAGQRPPFHPHHTAPYLKHLLVEQGFSIEGMTTFILTRHPVDMLWSYFNYFKPDCFGRYNYNADWTSAELMTFEKWVLTGRVGMHPGALALAPGWISTGDLTPLALEAHVDTKSGIREVDAIFRVEEIDKFALWLKERTDKSVVVRHVNGSGASALPVIGEMMLERIWEMFPVECNLYSV